jgi:hypothetical protein
MERKSKERVLMVMICGDSLKVKQQTIQFENSGAIPTSPHQLKLKEIEKKVASLCYERWHYFGKKGFLSSVNYGVYFGDKLMGGISFGIPNAKNIKGIYTSDTQRDFFELTRLALSDECPKNSESYVISKAIYLIRKKFQNIKGIITYADTKYNHTGTIYRASNFKYLGLTAQKTDLYVNGIMVGKLKGIKYRDLGGTWIKRSRKHLFIRLIRREF